MPDVARTLNNLANLQAKTKNFKSAETNYQEALSIRRKLAEVNPVYLPYLANTLKNLALCLSEDGQFEQAENNYQEALGLYKQLVQINPAAYLPDFAVFLNNLAGLKFKTKKFEQAESNSQEALEIRKQLAIHNPNAFDLPYCEVALNLCELYGQYVRNGNLQYVGLAKNLLEDAAQRLQKYPTVPQAQKYISEQLFPLQEFFKNYLP